MTDDTQDKSEYLAPDEPTERVLRLPLPDGDTIAAKLVQDEHPVIERDDAGRVRRLRLVDLPRPDASIAGVNPIGDCGDAGCQQAGLVNFALRECGLDHRLRPFSGFALGVVAIA